MNIQARIDAFFTLGDKFLHDHYQPFQDAKWKANNQNAWFLPEFIDQSTKQIIGQFYKRMPFRNGYLYTPKLHNRQRV